MKTLEMPKRGPKPKPDTRQNLLQAGLALLHSSGYAAAGIQSIVELANTPKGSFYNHFASKEDFGAAVIDVYFEKANERLQRFFGHADTPPLQQMAAYFDDLIANFAQNGFKKGCLIGNLSAEIADHSPLISQHLAQHLTTWSQVLERCLTQAKQQGDLKNPLPIALLSGFILNSWEGALLRMRVERSIQPLEEFKQVVFAYLLA